MGEERRRPRSRLTRPARGASSFWATSLTRPGRPHTSSRPPPQRPVRPHSRLCPQRQRRPENPGQGSGGQSARVPGGEVDLGGRRGGRPVTVPPVSRAQKPGDRGRHIPCGALPTTGTSPPVAFFKDDRLLGAPPFPRAIPQEENLFPCAVYSQSSTRDTPADR